MRKVLFILSAASILSACSTTPISPPKALGPTVVFVRDTGFIGSACTFNAIVDGEIIGRLNAGETAIKTVTPGRHKVAIDNESAVCANIKMSKVVEVAGDPVVFRVGITTNFQVIFDQTD